MPIERYTVGRSYTKRPRARADDPAAILTLMEELRGAGPFGIEGRLTQAEQWAIAYLQQKGTPPDPNAPCYHEPAWRRANERWSLVWYAIQILNTARMVRSQIGRGDARLAADLALDLGALLGEATIIQQRTGKQGEAGSAARQEIEQRHGAWRREAAGIWERHPTWSISEVARLIARNADRSFQTVRAAIADLDPRKKLMGK